MVAEFASGRNNLAGLGYSNSLLWPTGSDGDNGKEQFMKGSLLESNRWLREPVRRAVLLRVSAASSSAIEGIVNPFREKTSGTVASSARKRAKSEPIRS